MRKTLQQTLIFAAVILGLVVTASAQKVGGFKKVAVDDDRVIAAANFAVSKQEENNEGLMLDAGLSYKKFITFNVIIKVSKSSANSSNWAFLF